MGAGTFKVGEHDVRRAQGDGGRLVHGAHHQAGGVGCGLGQQARVAVGKVHGPGVGGAGVAAPVRGALRGGEGSGDGRAGRAVVHDGQQLAPRGQSPAGGEAAIRGAGCRARGVGPALRGQGGGAPDETGHAVRHAAAAQGDEVERRRARLCVAAIAPVLAGVVRQRGTRHGRARRVEALRLAGVVHLGAGQGGQQGQRRQEFEAFLAFGAWWISAGSSVFNGSLH
ncbi:hypothetical protein SDC9_146206 [bioreactor metagenome]|uniref:Uncharacterized protein n=1 Tax=bioreactor metagenome TaxID=1076179 RepID=A0A645EBG7_9ZZZZ